MLQIRRAYRTLALRWHPDKNRDGPEQARSRVRVRVRVSIRVRDETSC